MQTILSFRNTLRKGLLLVSLIGLGASFGLTESATREHHTRTYRESASEALDLNQFERAYGRYAAGWAGCCGLALGVQAGLGLGSMLVGVGIGAAGFLGASLAIKYALRGFEPARPELGIVTVWPSLRGPTWTSSGPRWDNGEHAPILPAEAIPILRTIHSGWAIGGGVVGGLLTHSVLGAAIVATGGYAAVLILAPAVYGLFGELPTEINLASVLPEFSIAQALFVNISQLRANLQLSA